MRLSDLWDDPRTEVRFSRHALENMEKRDIYTPEVIDAGRNGRITKPPEILDSEYKIKYHLASYTRHSENREVGVVLEADFKARIITIISVMWIDDKKSRAGTIR